ncbi:MAG: hypothetical protein HUU47_10565 [Bacteroidetes bacterium]|nr:hypothetical protein [Bacteroidota bacterium]
MNEIFSSKDLYEDAFLNETKKTLGDDIILLKGDLSGIQAFIFDVKSDGAARELKARSAFIDILLSVVEYEINENFKANTIINTGGNFYMFIQKKDKYENCLNELIKKYENLLAPLNLHLFISTTEITQDKNYNSSIFELESKLGLMKLKPWSNVTFFEPQKTFQKYQWDLLAGKIISIMNERGVVYFQINRINNIENENNSSILFSNSLIKISDYKIEFNNENNNNTNNSKELVINIPKWNDKNREYCNYNNNNDVLNFENLAHLAKIRKCDNYLCACLFDLDNMGEFLKNINSFSSFKKFSDKIKKSFQKNISKILNKEYKDGKITRDKKDLKTYFKDNIYVVYNGGDDAFILGAWDAVLEFMKEFHNEFNNNLNHELPEKPFSFSTAMVFFKHKYPIKRIAEILETNIQEAKQSDRKIQIKLLNEKMIDIKGHWNLFGANLKYEQYKEVVDKSKELKMFIHDENAGKVLLHRIRQTAFTYEKMIYRETFNLAFDNPELYRISYSMRNIKNFPQELIDEFERNFMEISRKNQGYIFPFAARFAEWKMKKKI